MSQVWAAYIRVVARDDDQHQIAAAAGVNQSTASRWKRGTKTPTNPANVAAFARKYGRNPLEAFIAADMITEAEAGRGLSADSRELLALVFSQARAAEAPVTPDEAAEARAAMRAALDADRPPPPPRKRSRHPVVKRHAE